MTRSSSGGLGPARGTALESRVLAWLGAHMLAGQPLSDQWAPSGVTIDSIGGQTARPIDDVGAVTDTGGHLLIQAKARLELGTVATSPLAKAIRQVVTQYHEGIPADPENGAVLRPVDPDSDRLMIVTDLDAPLTVREGLIVAAEALSELDDSLPFTDIAGNKEIISGRTVLLDHLRREWKTLRGSQPTDADLRSILRVLRIIAVDLRDDGEQHGRALQLLGQLEIDALAAMTAWRVLTTRCHELAERKHWTRKIRLRQKLASDGVVLGHEARLRRDISCLRRLTESNIRSLASALTIAAPEGSVALARTLEPQLLCDTGNLAVTGAPGTGKSVLLHALATAAGSSNDVVVLRSDDLKSSRGATRVELGTGRDLAEILREWTGLSSGLLVIDGLDQNTGENTPVWLPDLARDLVATRWRIVASIRTYDLHSVRWRSMFAGDPPIADAADPNLTSVRHMLVADLTCEELAPLRTASPRLASMLDQADRRMRELLANPFNLDLAARLLTGGHEDLTSVHTRDELLLRYWTCRVAPDGTGSTARMRALEALVRQMLATGQQAINPVDLPESHAENLDSLRRIGVLCDLPDRGNPVPPVQFRHPVLFDYVVAKLVLGNRDEPESLADVLDSDPNLALTVRPSIEHRLAEIWDADASRRSFWRLALRLASAEGGHVLAAAAAARVAARQMQATSDIVQLRDACTGDTVDPARRWDVEQAHQLAFLLAACVVRRPHFATASTVLADLAAALAADARRTDDSALASLAAQMLLRAFPNPEDNPDPTFSAQAAAARDCVQVALADVGDPHRGPLAGFAARLLGGLAPWGPAALATAINAIIAPRALAAWGGSVIWPLIDQIPKIVRHDPELAVTIGAAAWEYEQPLASANGLSRTVDDLLGGARYALRTHFPTLMAADPLAATRLLLRIVELPRMYLQPKHSHGERPPLLRLGEPLEMAGGHEALLEMAQTFVDSLSDLTGQATAGGDTEGTVSQITARLLTELRHSEVWRLLLTRAATTAPLALGHALLPALTSSSLYTFPTTWPAAAHLAARLSPTLTARQHESLEAVLCALATPDLPPSADPRLPERLKQRTRTMLSALDTSRLGPTATGLLADGDDPPQPLPNLAETHDHLNAAVWSQPPKPGSLSELTVAVQTTAQHLRLEDPAARTGALQRLTELWADLQGLLAAAPSTAEEHEQVRLELAKLLASAPTATPRSQLGHQIFEALLSACPNPGELRTGNSWLASPAGFSVTPHTNAIEGLVGLRFRQDWNTEHDQITRYLTALLDSTIPLERFLANRALPAIHPTNTALITELEERLHHEDDPTVAAQLMAQLSRKLHDEPQHVDQALQRLAQTPRWAVLAAEPDGELTLGPDDRKSIAVETVAVLACLHPTTHASRIVAHWLDDPVTHPQRAARVVWVFRDVFNPPKPEQRGAQQRVFTLLQPGLAKLAAAYNDAAQRTDPEPGIRDAALNATKVAETLAQQLFVASGAFDHVNNAPPDRGQTARFAALAMPALKALADIHTSRITRHIVATAAHIAAENPKQALLIAAQAVNGDHGYWRDQGGLDTVLKLVRDYITNYRSTVFDGGECTTALRRMLESFTRLGWDQAVDMLEELDGFHY